MPEETYHWANIRELLARGFNDEELRDLCFDVPDFRPACLALTKGYSRQTTRYS